MVMYHKKVYLCKKIGGIFAKDTKPFFYVFTLN